jgi:hypothetical protein
MHFPHFFGNAPTTSRQGTLPFYKNKNRGNLCQNVKNYILTYQVISNKFTIVRLCTLQRNYKPCGTRHRFPNPIKYPGRFINFGAYESVGITATLCVDFILPAKTSARTNMAVDTLDTTSLLFQSRLTSTSSNSKKILIIIF